MDKSIGLFEFFCENFKSVFMFNIEFKVKGLKIKVDY